MNSFKPYISWIVSILVIASLYFLFGIFNNYPEILKLKPNKEIKINKSINIDSTIDYLSNTLNTNGIIYFNTLDESSSRSIVFFKDTTTLLVLSIPEAPKITFWNNSIDSISKSEISYFFYKNKIENDIFNTDNK